jgi:hypothetical protein
MNGVQLPMLVMPVLIFVAMMVAAEVGRRLGRVRWLRSDDADAVGTSAVDAVPRYGLIRLDDYDQTLLDVRADFDRPE